MPQMAETEARRPHPIVRRRACQDSFREHRGDSTQTEDIVCGIRSTYGGGVYATEMFEELVGSKGCSRGQENVWLVHLKDDMSVIGMEFEGWRKAAQMYGRWFRRAEGIELFMRKGHETERRRAAE